MIYQTKGLALRAARQFISAECRTISTKPLARRAQVIKTVVDVVVVVAAAVVDVVIMVIIILICVAVAASLGAAALDQVKNSNDY